MSELPFLSSDDDDENQSVGSNASSASSMAGDFDLEDDFGTSNFADGTSGAKTGSWDFRSAIEILARNDMRAGAPARTKVDDLIKAQRKMMKGGGDEDEEGGEEGGSEDEVDEVDSSDEGDASEDDDDDDDASSSSSDEDSVDNEYENADLEEDNVKTTLDKKDEGSDDSDDSDGSDEDEDEEDDDDDDNDVDSEEEAELKKEANFYDTTTTSSSSNSTPTTTLFSELNISRPIMRGISAIGYVTPTSIQAQCIPPALAGRDICASAVTGSGKTAAFILPILERIIHMPCTPAASRALILTPTRELAAQCLSMTLSIARYTSIKCSLIVGGSKNNAAQAVELKNRPDLIIATPGRLLDHVQNAASFDLDDIVILVLDEADRLLDLGFIEEVTEIVKACPVQRQTLLFSATFSTKVDDLVNLSMKKPLRVKAGRQESSKSEVEVAPRLEQEFVRIRQGNEGNREAILLSLLTRTFKKRVICFFDTKVVAHKMMIVAGLCGIKCGELHGNLTQTQRLEALEAFKNREIDVLLCTDLAARGLDISNVETVINYEMPTQIASYVHRVGRTARAGCGGRSCTMISEGRRHLMKEVVKDAEKKNEKNSKKKGSKGVGAVIRSRTVPLSAISHFNKKIISLQPHIEEIKAAEEVAKIDRLAQMEATRAKNIMIHADEIKARPKKDWFQSKSDKEATKLNATKKNYEPLKKEMSQMGDGKHRMTRKKLRRIELRKSMAEMEEERRLEREETGMDQKKTVNEETMKATVRAQKIMATRKRDVEGGDNMSLYEEFESKKAKKAKRPKAFESSSIFDDVAANYAGKKKSKNGDAVEQQGKYKFVEADLNKKLKKGAKKSVNKFKSKSKYKRR